MGGTTISIKLVGGNEQTFRFEGSATKIDLRGLFFKNKTYQDCGIGGETKKMPASYEMDGKTHTMVVQDKTIFDKIINFLNKLNGNLENDVEDKKNNKKITVINDSDLQQAKGLEHMKPSEEEPSGRFRDENGYILDYNS